MQPRINDKNDKNAMGSNLNAFTAPPTPIFNYRKKSSFQCVLLCYGVYFLYVPPGDYYRLNSEENLI